MLELCWGKKENHSQGGLFFGFMQDLCLGLWWTYAWNYAGLMLGIPGILGTSRVPRVSQVSRNPSPFEASFAPSGSPFACSLARLSFCLVEFMSG